MRGTSSYRAGLALLVFMFSISWIEAQASPAAATGSITGTVVDPQGTVIRGAQVTVTNESTGERYATTTDADGFYRIAALVPGNYSARIVEKGFVPEGRIAVSVVPSRATQVDSRLSVGECNSTCVVGAEYRPQTAPAIALRISGERDVIRVGSELWLNVVLTNTTNRYVFVEATAGPNSTFAYQIQAVARCGCGIPDTELERQRKHEMLGKPRRRLRVPPGGTLRDRVDVSQVINLNRPDNYSIVTRYYDTSESNTIEVSESNTIEVTVVPPR